MTLVRPISCAPVAARSPIASGDPQTTNKSIFVRDAGHASDGAGNPHKHEKQGQSRNAALAGQLVVAGDYFKLGSLLYQKVLDPNIRTQNKKNTLLHTAFEHIDDAMNQRLVVYELLASGANVNARNRQGLTPLDFAVSRTKPNAAAIDHLLHFGAEITPRAQQRAVGMAHAGERWLLEALRDPKGRQANPPLHAPHALGPFV